MRRVAGAQRRWRWIGLAAIALGIAAIWLPAAVPAVTSAPGIGKKVLPGIRVKQSGVVFRSLQCVATGKDFVARGRAEGWRLFVGITGFTGPHRRYLVYYGDSDIVVKVKPPVGPWFDSENEPSGEGRLTFAAGISFSGKPKGSILSVGAPFLYNGVRQRVTKIITVIGSAECNYIP